MMCNVHRDLDRLYGVKTDVIIIRYRSSRETNVMISTTMALRQRNLGPVDASQDREEKMKISQSLVAQAGTKKEFTETDQYRRGKPPQLSRVPLFAQSIGSSPHDVGRQHHNLPTGPLVGHDMHCNVRKRRPQLIPKIMRYFHLQLPFENGDELKGEHVVGNDFQLVPLGKDTKA